MIIVYVLLVSVSICKSAHTPGAACYFPLGPEGTGWSRLALAFNLTDNSFFSPTSASAESSPQIVGR